MKKFLLIFMIFFGISAFLFADEYVTTDSGKKVLLKSDGTWEYSGETLQNISTSEWIGLRIKSWRWYNHAIELHSSSRRFQLFLKAY